MNLTSFVKNDILALIYIVVLLLVLMFLAAGKGTKRFCLFLIGFIGVLACLVVGM